MCVCVCEIRRALERSIKESVSQFQMSQNKEVFCVNADMDRKTFLKTIWWKQSQLEFASVGDEMYAVASSWLKKWRESR